MQLFGLHKNIYKLASYACTQENIEKVVKERYKLLGDWEILKSRGVPDAEIAKVTGISRATYYRRKKAIRRYGISGLKAKSRRPQKVRQSKIPKDTKQLILQIRQNNPSYGKSKITTILIRDHNINLSESSVGRILKFFKEQGLIKRSAAARRLKRCRKFKSHANKWRYGMRSKNPGELIQIDHMSVRKNDKNLKHFQAWDPITKMIVADVTSNATSFAAAKFLDKVIEYLPYPVKSIQVDGGSEFMRHFENKCAKYGIKLFVLPPSKPQYNGGVERGNRTFRSELYSKDIYAETIDEFRDEVNSAVDKYNTYRPHFSLNNITPRQYTKQLLEA